MLPKAHLTSHSRMSGSRAWSHHHDYLGHEDLFCTVLLCILATCLASFRSIQFLSFVEPIFAWNIPLVSLIFLKKSFLFYDFCLFLCIDHWGRLSYLSLLFFGTLHSSGYIFPFLLCFSLLFFSQLFVRPPQTAFCFFAFLFRGDDLDPCLLYNVMNLRP